ncbi:carbohydrate-binding module family 1 protein [Tulasnella calospora MUT 4182]|uniref:Carbohydrate-binding module family 1 protein n=1 Tax=Tulasnella calospora MUT 4182 TaxID=1051891 RepID=A0A0C3Q6J9_9AGAM|nr:carbohydrate-binding module family 1 protein [Tulasnella calospora MUT 4182]
MPRLSFSLAAIAAAAAFFGPVTAQSPAWGQGWTGATTCVAGWTCVYSSIQCLQGTTTAATTSTTTTTKTSTTTTSSSKTSSTSTTSKTSTTTATTTGTAVTPIQTLVSGWLWIRAVEAPNFHKYLQSYHSYAPGDAILGDYTTAAQFNIVNGQLEHYLPDGSLLYLQVEQPADSTVVKLKTSFATTPNTFGTFAFSGDAVTWTVSSITRPNNAAWLACTDATEGALLYINLGPYAYNTPAGCADETIH